MVNLRRHEHVTSAHCSRVPVDKQPRRRTTMTRKRHSWLQKWAEMSPIFDRGPVWSSNVSGTFATPDSSAPAPAGRSCPLRPDGPYGPPSRDVWHGLCSTGPEQSAGNGRPKPPIGVRGVHGRFRAPSPRRFCGRRNAPVGRCFFEKTKKADRSVCRERDGTAPGIRHLGDWPWEYDDDDAARRLPVELFGHAERGNGPRGLSRAVQAGTGGLRDRRRADACRHRRARARRHPQRPAPLPDLRQPRHPALSRRSASSSAWRTRSSRSSRSSSTRRRDSRRRSRSSTCWARSAAASRRSPSG